jgi:hypothetical protein
MLLFLYFLSFSIIYRYILCIHEIPSSLRPYVCYHAHQNEKIQAQVVSNVSNRRTRLLYLRIYVDGFVFPHCPFTPPRPLLHTPSDPPNRTSPHTQSPYLLSISLSISLLSISQTADDEESEATNLRIKHLYGLIQEEERFDLLDLLVDRRDPVQSVENFFDFAFLIKVRGGTQLGGRVGTWRLPACCD